MDKKVKEEDGGKEIDLQKTFDAAIWADEFVRLFGGDRERMVVWFGNAIMVGYDKGMREGKEKVIEYHKL